MKYYDLYLMTLNYRRITRQLERVQMMQGDFLGALDTHTKAMKFEAELMAFNETADDPV